MRGLVCAFVFLLVATTVAHAGKYKAYIETEPTGATVYFDSTETTPVCKTTPCTVDVPAIETIVYIQLENYTPEIISIDPAKKAQKFKVVLKAAVGTLVVEGADGARVIIADEDKGKAPDKFELAEGSYHVVILGKGDKNLYDDFVEIKAGEETTVEPLGGKSPGGEGPEKPDPDGGGIVKPGPEKPRDRYIQGSAVMNIGFRTFRYENNTTANDKLLDADEAGQVMLGPMVELWPTEIAGLGKLRGLSIMAHVGFNVNPQPVMRKGGISTSLSTFWQTIEVLIRHRWHLGDMIGLELHGGYGREAYQFNGQQDEIDTVPDAVYQSVRIGFAVTTKIQMVEPYLVGENRIVLSGGPLESRFMRGADASGLHAAVGATARFGPIGARLEGNITRYSWTFNSQPADTYKATGGTDLITQIQLSVGYAY